jgi:lipopolysaccharide/colanic/teichoic acid biosynthesis glycosyltransferase
VFDAIMAVVGLVILSPLLAAAAAAVRLSSPGPIFFTQKRVGEGGREFEIVKFRTMRQNEDSDTTWNVAEDHRLTRVGRFLRRTSIDELPQLLNVVRGNMSLVGPRPERPYFAARFASSVPGFADRHRAPVGMTGWAQIHGRGGISIQEKVRFDNQYVQRSSLWLDLVTLGRTILEIVRGSAYEHTGPLPDEDLGVAAPARNRPV